MQESIDWWLADSSSLCRHETGLDPLLESLESAGRLGRDAAVAVVAGVVQRSSVLTGGLTFHELLTGFARQTVGQRHLGWEAEDFVQDWWLKLIRRWSKLDLTAVRETAGNEVKFLNYCRVGVKNMITDRTRTLRRHPTFRPLDEPDSVGLEAEAVATWNRNMTETIEADISLDDVLAAIEVVRNRCDSREASDRNAEIARRHFTQGEELKSIATNVGLSTPRVHQIKESWAGRIREELIPEAEETAEIASRPVVAETRNREQQKC